MQENVLSVDVHRWNQWLQYMYTYTWFVVTGLKRENPLILNACGQLQIMSGDSIAYINTLHCLCVRL